MCQTKCGIGSTELNTRNLRKFLYECINEFDIKSVVDAGCGDLYWITLDYYPFDYIGIDQLLRKEAIERAREGWVLIEDSIETGKYRGDLTICKDVLRHHDEDGINAIINNINECSGYLLADYDEETRITNSWHRVLKEDESYDLYGNKVDLREWLGDPIQFIESNELETKRYGLWEMPWPSPIIRNFRPQ